MTRSSGIGGHSVCGAVFLLSVVLAGGAARGAPDGGANLRLPLLPVGGAPRLALQGASALERAREIRAWFAANYARFETNSPAFRLLVGLLAEAPETDAKGQLRVHPMVWERGLSAYNTCVRLCLDIERSEAPAAFKRFLADVHADALIARQAELDLAGLKERLSRIPADSQAVPVAAGGVIEHLRKALPGFDRMSPLARKQLLDGLAELNPNFRREGFYRTVRSAVREAGDFVPVPLSGEDVVVFLYRVLDPGAPILIPPAATLADLAVLTSVDLRDFAGLDLRVLASSKVESLDLSYTAVTNMSVLGSMTSLRCLTLAGASVTDLSPLRGMALQELDVSDTPIADLLPLKGMPLRTLRLANTAVHDLAPLEGMPLATLDVQGTLATNLAPLRGLPLRELALSRRAYAGLAEVCAIPSLKTVCDCAPSNWLQRARDEDWQEPAERCENREIRSRLVRAELSTGSGQHPCDYMSLHFQFDPDGSLRTAYATVLPDANVIHPFRPSVLTVRGGRLTGRAVVPVVRPLLRTEETFGLTIEATLGEGRLEGSFVCRYEDGQIRRREQPDVRGRLAGTVADTPPSGPDSELVPDRSYPCWRGPFGNGAGARSGHEWVRALSDARFVWISDARIPDSYTGDSRFVAQKRKSFIGGGYAAPIVDGGRVFVFYAAPSGTNYDEKVAVLHARADGYGREKWRIDADDALLCLDGRTGRTLWTRVFPRKGLNLNGYNTGDPQPLLVPHAAAGRVYAMGTAGRVYCVEAADGRIVWESSIGFRADALEEVRRIRHRRQRLSCFNHDLGTSPTVAGGVVVCSDHTEYAGGPRHRPSGLTGLDAATGRRLWSVPAVCGLTASPVRWVHADKEFVLASAGKVVCVEPAAGRILWEIPDARFETAPGLSEEFLVCNGSRADGLCGFRISPAEARKVWRAGPDYAMAGCAPVVLDGHVYVLSRVGLSCIEVGTGKVVGTVPMPYTASSLVGADGRVVAEGMVYFDAAPASFRPLGGAWGPFYARSTTPAIADGRLFFRSPVGVLCYDLRAASKAPELGLDVLVKMLEAPAFETVRRATVALCTVRGEEGHRVLRETLARLLKEGNATGFNSVLRAMEERNLTAAAAAIAAPVLLEAIASTNMNFYGLALGQVMKQERATREAAVPTLVRRIKENRPDVWLASARALVSIGPSSHREMIIEAMAPRVESADGEVSRCASATLDDVGQGTQSKPHREMLARAFFEAWRRHGYRDDAYYDGLSRLGSDAAALAPELEKLVYDPAHGRKAAWLLRAVRRGKTQPIGPRLEEAMPKGDSRDLGTDLE